MTTPTSDQHAASVDEHDPASFSRYLMASIGTAGLALGARLVLRRPHRALLGGGVMLASAALMTRGVRGQWPTLVQDAVARVQRTVAAVSSRLRPDAASSTANLNANEGEGSRTAARSYGEQLREFIDDGRVAPAARSAAMAVDGPEAASLREAEAKARTSPTNGH